MSKLRAALLRYRSSALLNQAVNGLSTLIQTLVAAHTLSPVQFGKFATVQILTLLVAGLHRAGVLQPVLFDIRAKPECPVAELRHKVIVIGVGASLVLGVTATATDGALQYYSGSLALIVPVAFYWDAVRVHYQGKRANRELLVGDLVGAAVGISWFISGASLGSGLIFLSLGLAAGPIASSVVLLPPWSGRWKPWKQRWPRRTSGHLAGDFIISTGFDQVVTVLAGVLLSPLAVGAVRLAQTTVGPVAVLMVAQEVSLVPLLRGAAATVRQKLLLALRAFAGISAVSVVIGATLTVLPDEVGSQIFGPSWQLASSVVLAVAVRQAAAAAGVGGVLALRTSNAADVAFKVRLVTSPASAALLLPVLLYGNLCGFAWSVAGLQCVNSLILVGMAYRLSNGDNT